MENGTLKIILAILVTLAVLGGLAYLFLLKAEKYVVASETKKMMDQGREDVRDLIGAIRNK